MQGVHRLRRPQLAWLGSVLGIAPGVKVQLELCLRLCLGLRRSQQSGGFEVIVELMHPGEQSVRHCSVGIVAVITDHLLAGPVDLEFFSGSRHGLVARGAP